MFTVSLGFYRQVREDTFGLGVSLDFERCTCDKNVNFVFNVGSTAYTRDSLVNLHIKHIVLAHVIEQIFILQISECLLAFMGRHYYVIQIFLT